MNSLSQLLTWHVRRSYLIAHPNPFFGSCGSVLSCLRVRIMWIRCFRSAKCDCPSQLPSRWFNLNSIPVHVSPMTLDCDAAILGWQRVYRDVPISEATLAGGSGQEIATRSPGKPGLAAPAALCRCCCPTCERHLLLPPVLHATCTSMQSCFELQSCPEQVAPWMHWRICCAASAAR